MSDNLSKEYKTRDEAAMGGFKRIKDNNDPFDTYEFAFYIISTFRKGEKTYQYTPPVNIGAAGGELTRRSEPGKVLQAYCHTHPRRIQHEGFSSGDLTEYEKKAKVYPGMVWYLMTFKEQLSLGESADEVKKGGRSVNWLPWVTP